MNEAYIGLGSNIGDAVQHILDAKQRLLRLSQAKVWSFSPLYLSAPIGDVDQPHYINAVLRCSVDHQPLDLLRLLQNIEALMGRVRNPENQNAPRIIDLDILMLGDHSLDTQFLTIPHPRMFDRRFVLVPLANVLETEHALRPKVEACLQSLQSEPGQSLEIIRC